jgi:hypothetical protein
MVRAAVQSDRHTLKDLAHGLGHLGGGLLQHHLAQGGLVSGPTNALIGERPGVSEAVLPLTSRVMAALASAITSQMAMPSMSAPSFAGAGSVFGDTHIHVSAPAGEYPDAHAAAAKMAREARRRGGFRR